MNKNLKYILVPALAGILFASCNTEPTGPTAAELDTQVEAKVKEASDKMKADCDAQIMNVASMKKDSILVKMGKMKAPPATPKAPVAPAPPKNNTPKVEPVKTEPVKTTPTIGNGKPKMGASQNEKEVGNGKPKMGASQNEKEVGNGKPKMGNK